MRVDLFDFDLPEERIALRPAAPRDSARLLAVRPDGEPRLEDRSVRDLPDLLRAGDVLVFNDTKVIPARLHGLRARGEVHGPCRGAAAQARGRRALARLRPAGKAPRRRRPHPLRRARRKRRLRARAPRRRGRGEGESGEVVLRFSFAGAYLDEAIERFGEMPLPPYIAGRRAPDERDRADYQTLYAREEGAVAAPTAGLHFTDALLRRLDERGIGRVFVTLHVGPGTFLPVKAEDTAEHRMHAEFGTVSAEAAAALNAARARGGRIVAVGTTALRLLESAARPDGTIAPFAGETDIFITPGYRFRAVDALMTNFHLPRSTLFMLVCAFSGLDAMKAAYAHAIAAGYRFYSYGDACLLFPRQPLPEGEAESRRRREPGEGSALSG